MREIKFRMWSPIASKYFLPKQSAECLIQQLRFNAGYEYLGIPWDHEKDGMVFEEYTGLQDKNGKDIYEGDIVKTQNKYTTKIVYGHAFDERGDLRSSLSFMRVGLKEEPYKFKGQDVLVYDCGSSIFYDLESLEIIGNIHEHKHLLDGIS